MNPGAAARAYLRRHHSGVLSTISKKLAGYPFGSVVPFILDHAARPVILISRLAEHTRNIESDARVSLLVNDAVRDIQAGARLTLAGDAARAGGNLHALRARYLNYFPDAARLIELGDFTFYVIEPQALRFIGGFGDIRWVSPADYAPPDNSLLEQEDSIIASMNLEPSHWLRDYCRYFHGRNPGVAIMAGIDCDGFDVRADGALLRFDFEQPVTGAATAREALAAMARKARAT